MLKAPVVSVIGQGLLAAEGIELVECDICRVRFSRDVTMWWPLCEAGTPHTREEATSKMREIRYPDMKKADV